MADTITSGAASASHVDDPDFAARIRERDAQALEEVVRRYLPQILRAAGGAGLARQLAEDVAQDTFVTFIETAPRFEGRSHVRTWLFGILYKKIAAARRNLGRDDEMDDIEEVFEQRFDDAGSWMRPPLPVDAEVYAAEVREGIDGCLDRVPTNQRMAFNLREIEGMDTEEICKILEVTRTNLGVLLHRVRTRLRECLEAKGIEP